MKRTLPASRPSEHAVLGMAMVDRHVIPVCQGEGLTPEDFYDDASRNLWSLLCKMAAEGEPTDMLAVVERANRDGLLSALGGATHITRLPDNAPSTENPGFYARIVRDAANARRALDLLARTSDRLYAGENVAEVMAQMEAQATDLIAQASPGDWVDPVDRVHATIAALEHRVHQRATVGDRTMGFGISDLDRVARFVEPDLVTVWARPGGGKTSLIRQLLMHNAGEGIACAYFSLEATAAQNDEKAAGARAGISSSQIREGLPGDDGRKLDRVRYELEALAHLPVYIDDTERISPEAIYAKLRRLKLREPDLRIAVVDYLGLMAPPWESRGANRALQLDAICYAMKGIAKRLGLAVVLASQLNRDGANARPQAEQGRGGDGALNASDLVVALHDPDAGVAFAERPLVTNREALVLKSRHGVKGLVIPLDFDGPRQRFYDPMTAPDRPGGEMRNRRGPPPGRFDEDDAEFRY